MEASLAGRKRRGSLSLAQFNLLQHMLRMPEDDQEKDDDDAASAPAPRNAEMSLPAADAAPAVAIAPAATAAPKCVEEQKRNETRFVPHTGPTVEYLICYRIQTNSKAMPLPHLLQCTFKPNIVAHYPETPKSLSGNLEFCELEKSLGFFLFAQNLSLRSPTEEELSTGIGEWTGSGTHDESGLPGDPVVYSFVLTNSSHTMFYVHCATVYVPMGKEKSSSLIKADELDMATGTTETLMEPISIVLITGQPFYVSMRERLRKIVAKKRTEAMELCTSEALKGLLKYFPPHVHKPQGHAWVSSLRDRASRLTESDAPAVGGKTQSSIFKCLFCGTAADKVYRFDKSSCKIPPAARVPSMPFDAVICDLVELLLKRKDSSVDCLFSQATHISEDEYELLLERLHADEAHANWDDISTTAIAHLLKRYLEHLPISVVPSDLFKVVLFASEANMSEWLFGNKEIKSMETGKTIENWEQHRCALKCVIGLILAIAKRSMANPISRLRTRALKGKITTAELRELLMGFSKFSRQAASFFAPALLRPWIENHIVQQQPWEKLVRMPAEESSLGFRSMSLRRVPERRPILKNEDSPSAFMRNKDFNRLANSVMGSKNTVKIRMMKIIPGKRQPIVEDCINFLSQRECLSATGIGIHKPPRESVELLYKIMVYRQLHDPYYDLRPAFEAAGAHVVMGAFCKYLGGLQSLQSKKLISRKIWEEHLLVETRSRATTEIRRSIFRPPKHSSSKSGISRSSIALKRAESFRAPTLPSSMTKPPPNKRISKQIRSASIMTDPLVRQKVVKLPLNAKEGEEEEEEDQPNEDQPNEDQPAPTAKPTQPKGGLEIETGISLSSLDASLPLMPGKASPKAEQLLGTRSSRKGSLQMRKRPSSMFPAQMTSITHTLFNAKALGMDQKILIRKILTLLAGIYANEYNGVDSKPLAERFMAVLFDTGVGCRRKTELEMMCESLIIERCNETKNVLTCVEKLISAVSKGNHLATGVDGDAKEAGAHSSSLAALIGCSESPADRREKRDLLVCPAPFPHIDLPYDTLFRILSPDMVVIFINAILCEVSIIFTSKSKRLVVDVLESGLSLMAPYEWQGLYIPLLPERMRHGVMDSPFPFIVGWVHQNGVTDVMDGVDIGECSLPRLIFNLDDGTIIGAHKASLFGVPYYEVDEKLMPPLPNRHLKRLYSVIRRIYDLRDTTSGTLAILDDSDEEKFDFFFKGSRQRILEIRWAVTSILISLFKNLRQCITVQPSGVGSPKHAPAMERVLNRDEFIATFKGERAPHIKKILDTQNFECFLEDHIISGGGNPFDHWCFAKVESMTDRFIRYKCRAQSGLLFKAKVGTETALWRMRYFYMKKNSQVIEYYDVPKDITAAQAKVFKVGSGDPAPVFPPETRKGQFVIQEGHSRVVVPKVKPTFFPNIFGLKKFKTPFQFQIVNRNDTKKSVLTCCAMTSDDRRQWITCLKSRIVNSDFLDQLRAEYKTRTSHIKDTTIKQRQKREAEMDKFLSQISDSTKPDAASAGI